MLISCVSLYLTAYLLTPNTVLPSVIQNFTCFEHFNGTNCTRAEVVSKAGESLLLATLLYYTGSFITMPMLATCAERFGPRIPMSLVILAMGADQLLIGFLGTTTTRIIVIHGLSGLFGNKYVSGELRCHGVTNDESMLRSVLFKAHPLCVRS